MPLLSYYTAPLKGETRMPELPINLRVLAESIFLRCRSGKVKIAGIDGEKGFTIIKVAGAQDCN